MTLPTTPGALDGTPIDLEAIKARCDAATVGPWEVFSAEEIAIHSEEGHEVVSVVGEEMDEAIDQIRVDARFIAHARMDVPNLVRRVEELEAQVRALCQPDAQPSDTANEEALKVIVDAVLRASGFDPLAITNSELYADFHAVAIRAYRLGQLHAAAEK
jgi:CMP-2-keto-3-deoxyoctulosonic acid synthetase